MFMDGRAKPEWDSSYPNNDHVDNVNVPSKTMWMHCSTYGGWSIRGVFADPGKAIGDHMGGDNFTFQDGHAATFPVKPQVDFWVATGGNAEGIGGGDCPVDPRGENSFTYPPEMNVVGSIAGADWWVVPWYPDLPRCGHDDPRETRKN